MAHNFRRFSNVVRFHVLTVASVKMTAFWDIAPCSLVDVDRRFRGAYCLHHQSNPHRPLKRRSTPTRLHGAISQKAVILSNVVKLIRHFPILFSETAFDIVRSKEEWRYKKRITV
jgi:hypothetical protein